MNSQANAINFTKGMSFSDGFVASNTLYVAGQQGPDPSGRLTGTVTSRSKPPMRSQR